MLHYSKMKKTHMKKRLYFILLSVPFFLMLKTSCKKERKPKEFYVEQYVKDWMFFDTGTWWTYKEINTGTIDSQYVTKSELIYITSENRKKSPYYTVEIGMVYTNSNFYFQLADPTGGSVIEKIRTQGSERGSTPLIFKPFKVGAYPPGSYSKTTNIEPSYQFGTITDTLITILNRQDESEQNDSVEYKILKGVGIVNKRNITQKQEWKLINYHINMNRQ